MTYPTISITEDILFSVVGNFLQSILDPTQVPVTRGQANRVAPPVQESYVVMWSITRERISTNIDTENDVAFTGSINGTTLTVTQMINGVITANALLDATGITANTTIVSQLTGTPGGVGTYQVSQSQTLNATTMQCGTKSLEEPMKVTVQLDCHGSKGADTAQLITATMRDETGTDKFADATINPTGADISPLYCNDPRQTPFINDSNQYEDRWSVDFVLQVNPVTSYPQDFAGSISVGISNVDADFKA